MNPVNSNSALFSEDVPNEVIVFIVRGHYYALPLKIVHEVVDPPPATYLPFVPRFVIGLVNIMGHIVPQIDLALRLHGDVHPLPPLTYDTENKVLLVKSRSEWGALYVDRVIGQIPISETPLSIDGCSISLLTEQELGLEDIIPTDVPNGTQGLLGIFESPLEVTQTVYVERKAFLLFYLSGQCWAVPIQRVLGIEENIHDCQHMPRDSLEIKGVTVWRGQPLLILDTAAYLGKKNSTEKGVVIIVALQGNPLGLYIEGIKGIIHLPENAFQPVVETSRELEGYLLTETEGLVSVLCIEGLIPLELFNRYLGYLVAIDTQPTIHKTRSTSPFFVFRIGNELCALPLDNVIRVEEHNLITPVPIYDKQCGLIGVLQSHGEILPVVDLRIAYQFLPIYNLSYSNLYILACTQSGGWALRVDHVERIAALPTIDMTPTKKEGNGYFHTVSEYQGKLVSVLTLEPLEQIQTLSSYCILDNNSPCFV